MDDLQSEQEWAAEEFGLADLGDLRRAKRLVQVAKMAASLPNGKVTSVFKEPAAREGAFRLLENNEVKPAAIALAAHRACARRSLGAEYVFVPVDETSLKLTDVLEEKRFGNVGSRSRGAPGLEVMTALAVSAQGTPLGLCGQKIWARDKPVKGTKKQQQKRTTRQKETKHWVDVMRQARRVFAAEAPQTRIWFQLDRGADAWPVLLAGLRAGDLFTVRAAQDRLLTMTKGDEERRHLWEVLEKQPLLATKELPVPARSARKALHGKPVPARPARTAKIELRAAKVELQLQTNHRRVKAPVYALLACETAESAVGVEPIEWMLLTSRPIQSLADANLVLYGYAQRWRIEDFHRTWKSGACNMEQTQLRDRNNVMRWAAVLASVAVKILRLTYLARHQPDLSSLEELSPFQVDAIVLSSKTKKHKVGSAPTMKEIVRLLAGVGGWTGQYTDQPPGALVLARGLYRIETLADALELGIVTPAH